jgi:hypothetical protein
MLNGSRVEMFDRDAAIGRVPVISADGTPLMPCKPAKAFKLLKSGKAFWKRGRDGKFYLKLKFNPGSPMVHPQTGVEAEVDFNSSFLAKVRSKAKRRRIWFRCLSKVERDILDLTIKYVEKPKSPRFIDMLAKIVVKVKASLMRPLQMLMARVGKPLARKLSMIARSWGNKDAEEWAEDESFARYLTVMDKTFQSLACNRKRMVLVSS